MARETGYVWLRRYRAQGLEGLLERNRAGRSHPNQTPGALEQAILELCQAHMRWGPRKLKRILERDQPGRAWPAASTMGQMLKREGLGGGPQAAARHGTLHAAAGACRWL